MIVPAEMMTIAPTSGDAWLPGALWVDTVWRKGMLPYLERDEISALHALVGGRQDVTLEEALTVIGNCGQVLPDVNRALLAEQLLLR